MEKKKTSCTTILVGKKASYDGSTMMARTEDASAGHFTPKQYVIVRPENQPKTYKCCLSKCVIELPDNPMTYSSIPNALKNEGLWGEAGINELNVGISETETITSNALVLGADPLVDDGIGEEDYCTILLPYIKSAKEGVTMLGAYLEKYGTYEMNGIGFQDENEVWWLETIGGHHWIAKRVPDDAYVVNPNQQGIDIFDFTDAFGEQKNHMCSKDLVEFITQNHLDSHFTQGDLKSVKDYKIRYTLGSHTDFDVTYNTCRAWSMLRYFNPSKKDEFKIDSMDLPWCIVPEHKITIQDVKYVLSLHYNGTQYDPYQRFGDDREKGKYRPIGINRTSQTCITQVRGYLPDKIKGVQWVAFGSMPFIAFVPQYIMVKDTPDYLKNVTSEVSTNNMYWTNRLIAALSDAHYKTNIVHCEQYQIKVLSKSHEFLNKFDKEFQKGNVEEGFLEKCNQIISDYFQKETSELLNKVLFCASNEMKNSFSRSDA